MKIIHPLCSYRAGAYLQRSANERWGTPWTGRQCIAGQEDPQTFKLGLKFRFTFMYQFASLCAGLYPLEALKALKHLLVNSWMDEQKMFCVQYGRICLLFFSVGQRQNTASRMSLAAINLLHSSQILRYCILITSLCSMTFCTKGDFYSKFINDSFRHFAA